MKKILLLLLLTFILSFSLFSQEIYTYDDLVNNMLLNNTDLRKADEAVVQSTLDVRDARANMMPNISFLATANYMPFPLVDGTLTQTVNPAIFFQDESGRYLFDVLNQEIPGLDFYPVAYDLSYEYESPKTIYAFGLTLTQPLVTWGKLFNAVSLYKEVEDVRKLNRTDTEKRLIAELKIRLDALYYIKSVSEILDKIIDTSNEIVDLVRVSSDSGMITSQILYDSTLSAKNAEITKVEIEAQERTLIESVRSMTGLYDLEFEDIVYEVNAADYDYILAYDLKDLIELSTGENSLLLQMSGKQIEVYNYQRKIAIKSMYLIPDIMLSAAIGYGGSKFPIFEKGWEDSDDFKIAIGITMTSSIFDGGKKLNDLKRAKSKVREAEVDYDNTINTIRETVTELYNEAKLSQVKIEYQRLVVENMESKKDLAEQEFNAGSESKMKFLSASLDLYQATLELVNESISLSQNSNMLYYLTGIDVDKKPIIVDGRN